ncbi:MAG: putative Ig domain-containing protein [Streptosporangiaceae bacterium]
MLLTRQAVTVAAAAGLGVLGISAPAIASGQAHAGGNPATHATARPMLPAGQHLVCPPAPAGQMSCMSIVRSVHLSGMQPAAGIKPSANGPYTPNDLRRAYKLTSASLQRGRGTTVAIVDAFSNPHANADLRVYRSHFHMPKCTTSNHCLRIVNQSGKAHPLPAGRTNWGVEISLDLDMVSAICPKCHILLVEAKNNLTSNLGAAVNRAVTMGAKYVSNSWGGREFSGQNHFSHFFNHPGRVITFASGDLGFGATFPADLQYVTSIGGTRLVHKAGGRGWAESVWSTNATEGTASGCSNGEAKPSWQLADLKPSGCLTRTLNDVAAVADPATGVLVFDTFNAPGGLEVGGTSASTPIITAIYALAGKPKIRTYPAQYSYLRPGHFFDVTTGNNGPCPSDRPYLCTAGPGYDGPTGLGTPNGITGLGVGSKAMVTVVDPGRLTGTRGNKFSAKIIGLDSRKVSLLHYNANGTLPPGLSIKSIAHSTNGLISGTVSATATPKTYNVTVSAKDGSGTRGVTHIRIVVH